MLKTKNCRLLFITQHLAERRRLFVNFLRREQTSTPEIRKGTHLFIMPEIDQEMLTSSILFL